MSQIRSQTDQCTVLSYGWKPPVVRPKVTSAADATLCLPVNPVDNLSSHHVAGMGGRNPSEARLKYYSTQWKRRDTANRVFPEFS